MAWTMITRISCSAPRRWRQAGITRNFFSLPTASAAAGSERHPIPVAPVAAPRMLLPDEMFAVAPAPVVGMDRETNRLRVDVVSVRVPAVAVAVADDAGGRAQRNKGQNPESAERQGDNLAARVHGRPLEMTANNALSAPKFHLRRAPVGRAHLTGDILRI